MDEKYFFNELKLEIPTDYRLENFSNITSKLDEYKNTAYSSNKINKLLNGIYDYQYGSCFPVLNVIYEREYFIKNQSRITIDTKIKYFEIRGKVISNHGQRESCFVVENKTKDLANNEMLDFFPFETKRFSKYCNGINKIYKLSNF